MLLVLTPCRGMGARFLSFEFASMLKTSSLLRKVYLLDLSSEQLSSFNISRNCFYDYLVGDRGISNVFARMPHPDLDGVLVSRLLGTCYVEPEELFKTLNDAEVVQNFINFVRVAEGEEGVGLVIFMPLDPIGIHFLRILDSTDVNYTSIYVIGEMNYCTSTPIPKFIRNIHGIVVNKVPKAMFLRLFDEIDETEAVRSSLPLGLVSALILGLTRHLYAHSIRDYLPVALRMVPDQSLISLRNVLDYFLFTLFNKGERKVYGYMGGAAYERPLRATSK
ncbi:hypothetical protein IPA_06170 [Ignicoccus pacificus DSM 13166]|uniref:Uncharacterized protein n=1 Tax=Ignicoccus pacificus DSM 13166 TaxID=940294 RepID=A0A977KBG8_9CREN|nr:hypothetical protein IPA_06170 [Ignicoccus pacificus DSM 13166]